MPENDEFYQSLRKCHGAGDNFPLQKWQQIPALNREDKKHCSCSAM